jgi:hypothetical protein
MRASILILLILLLLFSSGGVAAQESEPESIPIAYGDRVEGEITNDTFEFQYVFEGSQDDLVLIEMFAEPGTFGVDPHLQLSDENGELLFENDDFANLNSVMVTNLPDDAQYIITATRYGGEDGGSVGDYVLRLNRIEPAQIGDVIEGQVFSNAEDEESAIPQLVVLRPESAQTVSITFTQETGAFYAALRMVVSDAESYNGYATLINFEPGMRVDLLAFTAELEAERIYILYALMALSSYTFDAEPLDVTFTLNAVEE